MSTRGLRSIIQNIIHKWWFADLAVLLTLALVLAATAISLNPVLRSELDDPLPPQGTRWSGILGGGSAHANLWELSTDHQLYRGRRRNALYLVGKRLLFVLLLVLPVIAMAGGLLQGRQLARSHERRRTLIMFRMLGSVLTIVGAMALFVVLECHHLGIAPTSAQRTRVLVWAASMGLYAGVFLALSVWIGSRVRSARTATWILLSITIGLWMLEGSREPVFSLSSSPLPRVPELPTEVRMSLFRPSGEPRVTEDRQEFVEAYLDAVDAYSGALYESVRARYQTERLWHIFSPQLAMREISFQLLQDDFPTLAEIIYAPFRPYRLSRFGGTVSAVWPELVWFLALLGIFALLAVRRLRKTRSRP